jgi:DNA-binding NtrC family response regulator
VTWRALVACRNATWQGHTRQLAHAIEAAVIRAHGEGADALHEHHIFPKATRDAEPVTLQEATRQFQRRLVLEALEKHDWNVTAAAADLGLARSHVYNLINDFDLRDGRGREKPKDRT